MNAVAPLFVRGDNILSSPSVQWTVSCIRLTPRISISVSTRDNLDKRHRGTARACVSLREQKKRCLLCSAVWFQWNTVAVTNLSVGLGSLMGNARAYRAVG